MKNRLVTVRLEPEQYEEIRKKSERLGEKKVSEYIRRVMEQDLASNPEIEKGLWEVKRELSRIGNNINQIARAANMGVDTEGDRKDLEQWTGEIERLFFTLMEKIRES